jgi:hypothetical protein
MKVEMSRMKMNQSGFSAVPSVEWFDQSPIEKAKTKAINIFTCKGTFFIFVPTL